MRLRRQWTTPIGNRLDYYTYDRPDPWTELLAKWGRDDRENLVTGLGMMLSIEEVLPPLPPSP
jgi:hypothetical protein